MGEVYSVLPLKSFIQVSRKLWRCNFCFNTFKFETTLVNLFQNLFRRRCKKTVNEDNRMYYNTRRMDHKNQIHCGPSARRKKMENVKWILCFMIYKVFFETNHARVHQYEMWMAYWIIDTCESLFQMKFSVDVTRFALFTWQYKFFSYISRQI